LAATKTIAELRVSAGDLERMQAAATVVAECRNIFAAHPRGVFGAIGAEAGSLEDWRHYPDGEVYDPISHAQYFYHCHPTAQRRGREHGHFHTFLRAEGMPEGVAPLVLPETAVADAPPPPQAAPLKHGIRDEISHLVAIALDPRGEPIRLFATNRWVTGETWYRADDVIHMLDRFMIGETEGPALLNRWISAMVALFRPQIETVLRMRDDTVVTWRRRRRGNIFEDVRLEVLCGVELDLDDQLAFLSRTRSEFGVNQCAGTMRLPPMAEGWDESHAG